MSYQKALEAAGAKVLAFESFGSYQGEWWAKVDFGGAIGWVNGWFGSCSNCDAFEGEFGDSSPRCEEHRWGSKPDDCPECKVAAESHRSRLASFGQGYLDGLMPQEEAEAMAGKHVEWDSDAVEMLAWVKRNAKHVDDGKG